MSNGEEFATVRVMFTLRIFWTLSCVATACAQTFIGAPLPAGTPSSPARPEEQRARFSVPPGFEVELVASEEEGVGKPITVAWDDSGRLWTITALEYPLDGNEQPEAAKALYERGGRDKVLVIDDPYGPGPHTPRVFADQLAMPMGILPYKDGALVGQGPDVFLMHDTDGDGRADQREKILTGFGIQDSHLMPHQFTRVAGGWFYLAQGAFNYSRVKTKDGREHRFDQTRLARFTVDGMRFQDVTSGPCNIWGLVINQQGEGFIQEANDFGYPVMALQEDASYPGCTGLFKPYAPYFPSEVEFRMGGTGLSGLALSDAAGSFPGAYANVMYVANPITRKVQAIKIHREGGWYRYELLADFVLSSDEWFRPVAIHFGPDGCLYIVDWYNKIISHNEVPRTHPERDKTRGRIWRVRHKDQTRGGVPNVAKAGEGELLKFLTSRSTWEMRAAWHQIADRPSRGLTPDLVRLVNDSSASVAHRVHALWALEELKTLPLESVRKLAEDSDRNLRREAVRSLSSMDFGAEAENQILAARANDSDPQVRAEVIRNAASLGNLPLLVSMIKPALAEPAGRSPHNGGPMKLREAYDREFERYLIRAKLEERGAELQAFLERNPNLPVEAQLLSELALNTPESATRITQLLSKIERAPSDEELLRVIENLRTAQARETLTALVSNARAVVPTVEAMLKLRNRLEGERLAGILEAPVAALWKDGNRELAARAAGAFKLRSLAPELERSLATESTPVKVAALRALRELEAGRAESFAALADSRDRTVRDEALNSLSSAHGSALALNYWDRFNPVQRRAALRSVTSEVGPAKALVTALAKRELRETELDAETVERLRRFFPQEREVQEMGARLEQQFQPVLRLDGRNESYVDSNLKLEGAFTVETWIRLDPGINNNDGILGAPGGPDFNFHDSHFRIYCGAEFGDRAVAKRAMIPDAWTHLAVTRDGGGVFSVFINGELDTTDPRPVTNTFVGLDIGRTAPSGGTSGSMLEYRVWDRGRSAEEIRRDFDRSFAGEEKPAGLVWQSFNGEMRGGARIEKESNAPHLLTTEEAKAQFAMFERYRVLANSAGDLKKGQAIFSSTCMICHSVGGQGAQIGPVLNGAAASGPETLLRSILTPNAAMEAGYRTFRVELKDGETVDGFLVSRDENALVLRRPNSEDLRIPTSNIRAAEFTRNSLMPEGLLQALKDEDARDLLAYLKTLK